MGQNCFLGTLLSWSVRRWLVAAAVSLGTLLVLGLPTAVIANPVFGRTIAPTPWAMNVLIATSILAGLLTATYVRNDGPAPIRSRSVPDVVPGPRSARSGAVGGLLAYLAIGCPVCNKVVLIALGATGAVRIFAPVQPYLAAAGLLALAWALVVRLRGELACSLGTGPRVTQRDAMDVAPEPRDAIPDRGPVR